MRKSVDYDICRHWANFLLGSIRNILARDKRISDAHLELLLVCYQKHSSHVADSLTNWRKLCNSCIEFPGVQEMYGEIIKDTSSILPTNLAFCYGAFSLASQIHNSSLKDRLVNLFETNASMPVIEWTGSLAAQIGKALRAAQKHGRGNEILMELYRRDNNFAEMRRYTAVAATSLAATQRSEFFRLQRMSCNCWEEKTAMDYLDAFGEPLSPDRRIPEIQQGY